MFDIKQSLVKKERIQVRPGEHSVATGDVVLTTLLGSCVSACLYDPVNQVVGMNHFLLASRKYIPENRPYLSEAGRYGVHAMELLINDMLKVGAEKRHLQAKAFGGGCVLSPLKNLHSEGSVGEINTRFVRNFLEREGIPLVASYLGGTQGMLIHFFSCDHSVYVKKVGPDRSSDIVVHEQCYQTEILEQQAADQGDVDLWEDS